MTDKIKHDMWCWVACVHPTDAEARGVTREEWDELCSRMDFNPQAYLIENRPPRYRIERETVV